MGVSVIITCYNLERYIGEAIESVLSQEFNSEIEIIVVDDCSTDRSAEIIRSFPVRYIRSDGNSGVLLATLQGIKVATHDVVCFLDGDDVWEDGKLVAVEEMFARDPNCALVTHDLTFITGDGRMIERRSRSSAVLDPLDEKTRREKLRAGVLLHDDFVWLGSAYSIRKSSAKACEFDNWARSLPDPHNTYQDWPLAFWVASLSEVNLAYLPQKLLRYRMHGANHSGDTRTASRAHRNFVRARNTTEAMRLLAVERALPPAIVAEICRRTAAYDYLARLYGGSWRTAFRLLPAAIPTFIKRGVLIKEFVRFAGIAVLGTDRFAQLSAQQRQDAAVDAKMLAAVAPGHQSNERTADNRRACRTRRAEQDDERDC
jgi:glycosyltransferase involved in cell wall biosynthesis